MWLLNKSVVVTGAVSRKGKQIAIDFAKERAKAVIVNLKKEELKRVSI